MKTQETNAKISKNYAARSATLKDLEATTYLLNQCSLATIGVEDSSPGEIENDWGSPGFDLSRDSRLIFDPQGNLVAHADIWLGAEIPVHPYLRVNVLPDQDFVLLGGNLVDWAVERAKSVLEKVPPTARISLHSHIVSTHEKKAKLLSGHGFALIRHSWQMVIDLDQSIPDPVFPENISVRKYDHERDGEAVYRADYEAFQDHWGFVEESFEEGYPKWLHSMLQDEYYDPDLWFLAVDGDQIAGGSICRPVSWEDPNMGWVRSLFVRRPWRRQGIALGLLRHTFQQFQKQGKHRVGLGVDAQSLTGATDLYVKAGMRILRQYDRYERELRPGAELGTERVEPN